MEDTLFKLSEYKQQNKPFTLCIVTHTEGSTPRKAGAKMVVFEDGKTEGTVGGGSIEQQAIADALETLKAGKPQVKEYKLEDDLGMHCGGKASVYFEPVNINPNLYIFGAGHVGREVGRYAADVGFKTIFVDNRPDIAKEHLLDYAEFITDDYIDATEKIEFKNKDFVVITTPKHTYDEAIMQRIAKKDVAYVGMIGSKRKVAEARKRLLQEKTNTEEELDRVDMPIGIPFKAETPKEIAFSIVAKLIDVKNSKNL